MSRVIKMSQLLHCVYTDAELAEKRDDLADTILEIGKVEDQKASANRGFKERLDGLYAESAKLSHQIKNRGESRSVDCAVEYNKPNIGEKTTIRLDTGEMLKIEVMDDDERQEEIDFGLEENRNIQKLIEDAHKNDEPPQDQASV